MYDLYHMSIQVTYKHLQKSENTTAATCEFHCHHRKQVSFTQLIILLLTSNLTGPASAGMGIDLTQLARALDKERFPISQIGIQFIQVGDDPDTLVNLKVLDKELKDSCDSRVSFLQTVVHQSLMSSCIGYG